MSDWVDHVTGEVIDLSAADGVLRVLHAQQHAIDTLAARLADAQHRLQPSGPVATPSAWVWRDLGPSAARILWDQLFDWVGWLRGRYPLADGIPPCWWRHPEIVEELTALWLAWRAATSGTDDTMLGPIQWHDHWLPGVVHRVRQWGVHCTTIHRDRPATVYAAGAVDDTAAYTAMVGADVQQRRARVAGTDPAQLTIPPPEDRVITTTEMTSLVATGVAVEIGTLPGSPIEYDGHYWVRAEGEWRRVIDETVVDGMRAHQARLRLADEAVRKARDRDAR